MKDPKHPHKHIAVEHFGRGYDQPAVAHETHSYKQIADVVQKCKTAYAATVLSSIAVTDIPDSVAQADKPKVLDNIALSISISDKLKQESPHAFVLEFPHYLGKVTGEVAAEAVNKKLQAQGIVSTREGGVLKFTLDGQNQANMENLIAVQKERNRILPVRPHIT